MGTIVDISDTVLDGYEPIQSTIDYLKTLVGPIYLVSGRNPKRRAETVRALRSAGVKYSSLYMNPGPLSDNEFKYQTAKRLSGVTLAIDNDEEARAGYRRAGLKTLDPATLPNKNKMWSIW
jgi:hypothetical protein